MVVDGTSKVVILGWDGMGWDEMGGVDVGYVRIGGIGDDKVVVGDGGMKV